MIRFLGKNPTFAKKLQPIIHRAQNERRPRSQRSHRCMKFIIACFLPFSCLAGESLFNGKDLSQWRVDSKSKVTHWTAQDGVIHCQSGPKKAGSLLWTKKEFTNFTLSLDFKLGEGTIDSGVMIKNAHDQIQIGISGSLKRDLTASPYIPGKGYPVEGKEAIAAVKPKDWNTLKIKVEGKTYQTWLNGVPGVTYTSESAVEKGPLGLQLHAGKDMSISFRNLEITEKP